MNLDVASVGVQSIKFIGHSDCWSRLKMSR